MTASNSARRSARAMSTAPSRNARCKARCFPMPIFRARISSRSARAGAASCAPATRRRISISARLKRQELCFAEGPAGTGKTWLAVGYAVSLLEQGIVERLILSRPAVEAGERLGFLPGDMREKVDPYLRPIFDALNDFMDPRMVERGMQTGMIEVAPLAFMRGRTLTNACVLLDEAQNTTSVQMKMFLTRLGEGSRMIVTGDPTQVDLPPGQISGLARSGRPAVGGFEGIGHVRFADSDVVRHDLVRRIVTAYETRRASASARRKAAPMSTHPPSSISPSKERFVARCAATFPAGRRRRSAKRS